jgi:hypothetical protein
MRKNILHVSDDFWNFRGSYRIGGVIDVGTQCSLVRLKSGKFVFLDAYSLDRQARRKVSELTEGGENLEAILNVHPFHTIHVKRLHELYPEARLYGTARHRSRFPDLPWEDENTEGPALHEFYSADFEFSVPRGVDFIPADENLHFSSVLVYHADSKTIHSDDTLNYLRLPSLMRAAGLGDSVAFHPTLAKVLEKRAGAATEFRSWAEGLIKRWRRAENLCAAHTAALLARDNRGSSLNARWVAALEKVQGTLKAHEQKYG